MLSYVEKVNPSIHHIPNVKNILKFVNINNFLLCVEVVHKNGPQLLKGA
jgi:hypothetical protein